MARMTLKAVHTNDEPRRWTLSERIVDENLGSYHYVARRTRVPALGPADPHRPPDQCISAQRPHAVAPWLLERPGSHGQSEASPLDGDPELCDAAWLYAWSHAALRPVAE
jgi:hypothetical protein